MTDAIVTLVEGALSTPWGLLALAAVAAVDAFFPVVPSESLVVTAGVFAAAADQSLSLIVGYLGGAAFEGEPVKAVLLGLGLALSVAGAIELLRHARRRTA